MRCVATSCAWSSSAAYNVEKREGRPLTDDEYLAVLTREVKTRRESVEAFRAGGREDLVDKEEAEIAILGEYLPEPLDRGRDRRARARGRSPRPAPAPRVTWARSWAGSSPRTRGRADGKHVSELVAQTLAAADLAATTSATH